MDHSTLRSSPVPVSSQATKMHSTQSAAIESRLTRASSDSAVFVTPSQTESERLLAERKAKINEKYGRLMSSIDPTSGAASVPADKTNLNLNQQAHSAPNPHSHQSHHSLEESHRTQMRLRQQIQHLTDKLSREQKLLDASMETLKRTQSEYDVLRGEVGLLRQVFEESQVELQQLRDRCKELEARDQTSQDELAHCRRQLQLAQEHVQQLQQALLDQQHQQQEQPCKEADSDDVLGASHNKEQVDDANYLVAHYPEKSFDSSVHSDDHATRMADAPAKSRTGFRSSIRFGLRNTIRLLNYAETVISGQKGPVDVVSDAFSLISDPSKVLS